MENKLGYEVLASNKSPESVEDWRNLQEVAQQEVEVELGSRLQDFEGTVADKIFVLLQMMGEYSKMIPGTTQAAENTKRFHVEVVARLLKQAERDEQKISDLTAMAV